MLGFLWKLPGTALASADTVRYGVREGEVQKKNETETSTLQEQITFNEVRRGSSQISELLPLLKKRLSIYRHVYGKLLSQGGLFSKVVQSSYLLNGWGKEFWRLARGWTSWELGVINLNVLFFFFPRVREFFVLHRKVGRDWRGVLVPGYFEPCNFPPLIKQ